MTRIVSSPAKLLLAVERFAIDELENRGLAARFHQVRTSNYTLIFVASPAILCINILSDAYRFAVDRGASGHDPGEPAARAGRRFDGAITRDARRHRRRHRLRRPGAAAAARAPSARHDHGGDVVGDGRGRPARAGALARVDRDDRTALGRDARP